MSRKSEWFMVFNVNKERSVSIYGRNSVAKFLRENGCKFDDKRMSLVQGENAVVFKSKSNSFIVEESCD